VDYGTAGYGQYYDDQTSNTSHTVTLLDLNPGTTYHFRIKSKGSTSGNVNYSPDYTFTTLDPNGPVVSRVASSVDPTDATITWQTLNEESDSHVEYGITTAYGQVYDYPYSATYHAANLGGLSPGTTYHFRIKATGTSGRITYSADYTLTTSGP
jgi:phosphodiesterase/alkaline phosphatase D-like protein